MKKVLLATTALVMTAGMAAAEIKLSGSAEMGVVGGGDQNGGLAIGGEAQFHNDITLGVAMTGETDSGLSFGASVDFSKSAEGNPNGNTEFDNEAAFISGAFGTLTMGEIDSAMDWGMQEVSKGGTLGDDETIHAGYNGWYFDNEEDNQHLRYDYAFGDFAFAVSTELDDAGERNLVALATDFGDAETDDLAVEDAGDANYSVGAKYKMGFGGGSVTFGAGFAQYNDRVVYATATTSGATNSVVADVETIRTADTKALGISADVKMDNGLGFGVAYTQFSDFAARSYAETGVVGTNAAVTPGVVTDADHVGVGVSYTTGAWLVAANYGQYDFDNAAFPDASGYGLVVNYDLGGGAVVQAGYGDSDIDNNNGALETWSLGVAMAF